VKYALVRSFRAILGQFSSATAPVAAAERAGPVP
jgi:hypothetical protein